MFQGIDDDEELDQQVIAAGGSTDLKDVNSSMDKKTFHIFISYRVRTDAELAEKLCDKLQGMSILNEQRDIRIRCFFDKQNLTQGKDFQDEFLAGLNESCLFLPLISERCLKSVAALTVGAEDNVVREWETALGKRANHELDIIPILVGSLEKLTTANGGHSTVYKRFDAFWIGNNVPDITLPNSPTGKTAKDTVGELFRLQGIFLNPADLSDKLNNIVSRFSADIWPKYRPFWGDPEVLGAEPIYSCVQCLESFKQSENMDGSCRFHLSDGPTQKYDTVYKCCGSNEPEKGCTRARHRAHHHNEYPYGAFIVWSRRILNFTDASKTFVEINASDPSIAGGQSAVNVKVGGTLGQIEGDKVFVSAWVDKLWFNVWNEDELVGVDEHKPIFSLKNSNGEWAEARWLSFDGGVIEGVEISCGTKYSLNPAKARVKFTFPEEKRGYGLKLVSVDKERLPEFGEKALAPGGGGYTIPKEIKCLGPTLSLFAPREADASLPSWSIPKSCPLRIKVTDLSVRHQTFRDADYFKASIVIMNPTPTDHTIMEARGFIRLRCDKDAKLLYPEEVPDVFTVTKEWKKVEKVFAYGDAPPPPPPQMQQMPAFRGPNGRMIQPPPIVKPVHVEPPKLPMVVPASGALVLYLEFMVSTKRYGGADYWSHVADFSWISSKTECPIVIDMELEDMTGAVFGKIVEFVLPEFKLIKPEEKNVFWLPCDVPKSFERERIAIELPPQEDVDIDNARTHIPMQPVFKVKWTSTYIEIKTHLLRHMVHLAEQLLILSLPKENFPPATSLDVSKLIFGNNDSARMNVKCVALIDLGRRCVYGFRLEAAIDDMKSVGFFELPSYGDALLPGAAAVAAASQVLDVVNVDWPGARVWQVGSKTEMRPQNMALVELRVQVPADEPAEVATTGTGGGVGMSMEEFKQFFVDVLRPMIREEVQAAVDESMKRHLSNVTNELREEMRTQAQVTTGQVDRIVNESSAAAVAVLVKRIGVKKY